MISKLIKRKWRLRRKGLATQFSGRKLGDDPESDHLSMLSSLGKSLKLDHHVLIFLLSKAMYHLTSWRWPLIRSHRRRWWLIRWTPISLLSDWPSIGTWWRECSTSNPIPVAVSASLFGYLWLWKFYRVTNRLKMLLKSMKTARPMTPSQYVISVYQNHMS